MTGGLYLPVTRVAYVTTENTGAECILNTGQGQIQLRRVDPHGVEMVVAGVPYGITSPNLPYVGRFFLAAAVRLGVDINAGWDKPQHHADPGSELQHG